MWKWYLSNLALNQLQTWTKEMKDFFIAHICHCVDERKKAFSFILV